MRGDRAMTSAQAEPSPQLAATHTSWQVALIWFLAFSLLTRFAMLGDPNYHDDETLFYLIGQRMHDGLVPYVDIWDRKGPGLFLIFYLATGLSGSVIGYQIVALIFAALTALFVFLIARRFTGWLGAILAGTIYLAALPLFMGGGGQAGVFINLPVLASAWLVLGESGAPQANGRGLLAMLLAGFAITIKQTSLFEGAFLGLVLLWRHKAAGADIGSLVRNAALYALAGAAPMLVFAACYAAAGHFPELWQALVTANLTKTYNPAADMLARAAAIAKLLSPLFPLVVAGLALRLDHDGKQAPRVLLGLWLLVSLGAVAVIPNLIDHYMLPVLPVLSLCAAPALQRAPLGAMWGYAVILLALLAGPCFDFASREQSRRAIAEVAADIRSSDPAPRLLVFQGPVALYSAVGAYPPSPLIFPTHLFYAPERNTSHLDTAREVRKLLAWRPTVVVTFRDQPGLANHETQAMVLDYVGRYCRQRYTRNLPDRYGPKYYTIWDRCSPLQARAPASDPVNSG